MKTKKHALTAAAVIAAAGWLCWGNAAIGVTRYTVKKATLPTAFNGLRIAVVSDLHSAEFGKNNRRLTRLIRDAAPDLIAVTGDITDEMRPDIPGAAHTAALLAEIAPVFFVTGNHESRMGEMYPGLEERLLSAGVTVLRDRTVPLTRGDSSILLVGLDDPLFVGPDPIDSTAVLSEKLRALDLPAGFTVLFSHRPEAFAAYTENKIDLVLCGHAHGGQIRFPFAGGLFAPHQGFFPKYDAGTYTENGTTMIVSRGLGNSKIPVRVNDRPELVLVDLYTG